MNADIEARIKNAIDRTNVTRELMRQRQGDSPKVDLLKSTPVKDSFILSGRDDECSLVK